MKAEVFSSVKNIVTTQKKKRYSSIEEEEKKLSLSRQRSHSNEVAEERVEYKIKEVSSEEEQDSFVDEVFYDAMDQTFITVGNRNTNLEEVGDE